MPNRWDLDRVSLEFPVCAVRACGHAMAVNSKALEILGITADTPQIPGGEIVMEDGSVIYELEDGSHTTERPWQKRAVVSLDNFKRMFEPTYLRLLLRSLKVAVITTVICLLLMACSKKILYPWLISVLSLALPILLWIINMF